jgi:hypothetical protein
MPISSHNFGQIDATCNIRKPHHRIRVSKSMREDIKVWLTFLSEYNGVTVITDNAWASNETLELFTDSAGGQNRGFGIYFQGKWTQKCWPKLWEEMGILKDITFLELFPVVVALCTWGEQLKNKEMVWYFGASLVCLWTKVPETLPITTR